MSWVSRQRQVVGGVGRDILVLLPHPPLPRPPFTYLLLMMNRINHNLCRADSGIAYNMTTKHDHDHEEVFL